MSGIVAKAILRLEPNAQFAIFGTKDDYTIRWDSTDITQPSQSDLDASIVEVEKLDYQDKRRKEYPNIGDQLDLLYKDIVANKLDTTGEWAKKIKAVKDANAKEE